MYKVVFLGNSNVGKTSLLTRIIQGEFNKYTVSTAGAAMQNYHYEIEGKSLDFQIWDTAGQEAYKSLAANYLRDATFAIVVYSIIDRTSFDELESWIKMIHDSDPNIQYLLVGNKTDLEKERQVTMNEALNKCEKLHAISVIEVSALTGYSIPNIFETIAEQELQPINQTSGSITIKAEKSEDPWKKNKNCC
ncbi:small GTP-binding protein, putative [Trichomonas vaginalis G3]|uniref:Small GTP-binding protein, putative n=1 Tax=Trichomonas vaginalis (strain ATCC PRA-98 / G3) TaxID=412133 RepID=A2FSZ4_TRIV3|nr:retrograde vesicle-mediated transport, Golgi to ER [Trichomonas vaginalis G3]EAX91959.1 small GTP-binding protein, putative [Trichomonas vaginalis G3]KAI5513688.1 retrograde vesicle-mediated transport, Golgi to ER [Trichomonas vaginalis G3]|eukprot:XP_001304889.1 small GTP-binding protein [Trichomonas vaginalis G3]